MQNTICRRTATITLSTTSDRKNGDKNILLWICFCLAGKGNPDKAGGLSCRMSKTLNIQLEVQNNGLNKAGQDVQTETNGK